MDQDGIPKNPAPAKPGGTEVPADGLPPIPIPDHQLLRCIGRGSYGEVWLARNVMGLYRAVKIVRRQSFDNARPFERELSGIRKFEPVSRSHEGFVDVLHIGNNETQGAFYYVMELGDDRDSGQDIESERYCPKTLAHEISRSGKLSFQQCLDLGLALSKALAELHKHDLVHRDIKPSNIIFVLGVPKLADIGLVADVGEARSYVGTDGFIPPEGPGSPQADIYSLGKVLYEAATGKDRQDFPDLPSLWDQSPDHSRMLELNEVILQACANEPAKRYQSAADMQADLLLLASGKSLRRLKVLERRFSSLKRVARASALVLAVLGFLVFREWKNAADSRHRQVNEAIKYGNGAMDSGDLFRAEQHYADALRLDQGSVGRELAHRVRTGCVLAQCPKLTHLFFAEGLIRDAEFSPDGKYILIAENLGQAKIYDLAAPDKPPRVFAPKGGVSSAIFSPDGRWILTTSVGHQASLWNALTLENIRTFNDPSGGLSGRFSRDGKRVVTAYRDGVARVWDSLTGELQFELKGHSDEVMFATFSPNGQWIITTSRDWKAWIWDAQTGRQAPHGLLQDSTWVTHAAFSPDSRTVATACEDNKAHVWETTTGTRIRPDLHHRDMLRWVEYSPDGRLLLTAALDGAVRLWGADDLEPLSLNPVINHPERVTPCSFDSTGHRLVVGCLDGSIRVWDLAGGMAAIGPLNRSYSQHGNRFLTLTNQSVQVFDALAGAAVGPAWRPEEAREKTQLSRDGQFILTVSTFRAAEFQTNRRAQVWSAPTGKAIGSGVLISNSLESIALSDNGKRLAIRDHKTAQTWDVLSGVSLSPPLSIEATIAGTVFSPDGRWLAAWGGKQVQVWDSVTGKPAFPPIGFPTSVESVEFSPDGSSLATCCANDRLDKCFAQVWNVATGRPISPPLWHGDGVICASFSPDGKRLVTGGEDSIAMVWDVATGKPLVSPMRHLQTVSLAAFSSDGKWIATVSYDKAARIWNAATGDPVSPPLRHLTNVVQVAFLPDSRGLVTEDANGHAWVWELPLEKAPVEDLVLLAHFLSGDSVTPVGVSPGQNTASLQSLWQRLRKNCPAAFTVAPEQVMAWHELQARQSETASQWLAAAFHWQQLLTNRPGDPAFTEHLKNAEARFKNERPP